MSLFQIDHFSANEVGRLSPIPADVLYAEQSNATKPNKTTAFYRRLSAEPTPCQKCTMKSCQDAGIFPAVILQLTVRTGGRNNATSEREYIIRADQGREYIKAEAIKRIRGTRGGRVVNIKLVDGAAGIRECARYEAYTDISYGRFASE